MPLLHSLGLIGLDIVVPIFLFVKQGSILSVFLHKKERKSMSEYSEAPDYLPLSQLNAYAYCPRRFYYEFVLGEMLVNEHVLGGQQLHERVANSILSSTKKARWASGSRITPSSVRRLWL